jgi:hypothetical protein
MSGQNPDPTAPSIPPPDTPKPEPAVDHNGNPVKPEKEPEHAPRAPEHPAPHQPAQHEPDHTSQHGDHARGKTPRKTSAP